MKLSTLEQTIDFHKSNSVVEIINSNVTKQTETANDEVKDAHKLWSKLLTLTLTLLRKRMKFG